MAELRHHAELVRDAPVLDDLSVLDPDEVDHVREGLDPGPERYAAWLEETLTRTLLP